MLLKILHTKIYKENIKAQHSFFSTKKRKKKKELSVENVTK